MSGRNNKSTLESVSQLARKSTLEKYEDEKQINEEMDNIDKLPPVLQKALVK